MKSGNCGLRSIRKMGIILVKEHSFLVKYISTARIIACGVA
jgi:hypothetical protein